MYHTQRLLKNTFTFAELYSDIKNTGTVQELKL